MYACIREARARFFEGVRPPSSATAHVRDPPPPPLDRYSHWMPSMGKHTAIAMDDALADREDDTVGEEFTV
jgi:hypothetical protein